MSSSATIKDVGHALPVPHDFTPAEAQEVVFNVIKKSFPNAVPAPTQPLSQYGYTDGPKLIGLRDAIYGACGIYINAGKIIKCQKLSDVIDLL